jgi:hypothetical protein
LAKVLLVLLVYVFTTLPLLSVSCSLLVSVVLPPTAMLPELIALAVVVELHPIVSH